MITVNNKKEGWEKAFKEVFQSKNDMEFSYGKHDCCIAVGDCIVAIIGIDIIKEFRIYRSLSGAKKLKKKFGDVEGIADHIAKKFGFAEIKAGFAGRGDVTLVEDEDEGKCLGIIEPSGVKVATASDFGWKLWSRTAIIKAWKIG